MSIRLTITAAAMALTAAATAQNAQLNYIQAYKVAAQEQMQKHGIPASITLAQGVLESGSGQSRLAVVANNHFGIKVGSDWNGPYILQDDDAPNEKFRVYNSPEESYEDHSLFLQRPRYQRLRALPLTDYRGWANGLQECGYATNPRYAQTLIDLIDRYSLWQYDGGQGSRPADARPGVRKGDFYADHQINKCNGLYYIVVRPGDNIRTVADAVGKNTRKLRRYNDIPRGGDVYPGQIIYLHKKKSSADISMRGVQHIVQPGESMYTISQMYGIKVKSLYKMNNLSSGYTPMVGHRLTVNTK